MIPSNIGCFSVIAIGANKAIALSEGTEGASRGNTSSAAWLTYAHSNEHWSTLYGSNLTVDSSSVKALRTFIVVSSA